VTESARANASRRVAKENENETRDLPHGSKPRSPGMEPSNQAGRTAPGLQSYRFEKKTARFQRQSHTHTARDRRFPRVASRRVPRDSDRAKERTLRRRNRRANRRIYRARLTSSSVRRTIFFGAAAFLAGVAFFGAVFLTAVFVAGAFVLNMMIVESRRGVPHTAPSRSRPSLRPSRSNAPSRSIDGISRSVPMEYRSNAPIEISIPIERPDRSNAPIQIQIEIEIRDRGRDRGFGDAHGDES
jgi:hypothetical protein